MERLTAVIEGSLQRRALKRSAAREDGGYDLEPLYQRYPRKEGKARGMTSLRGQIKTPEDLASLERAVDAYAQHVAKNRVEPRYVMQFATFAGRWREWINGPPAGARQWQTGRVYDFGGE